MVPTILVVDDNPELVALLTSLFEEAGYTVAGAYKLTVTNPDGGKVTKALTVS